MTRFCPLRELNFNHANLLSAGVLGKLLAIKMAINRATAKIAGTNLPDQITTMLAVVLGNRTLARIVRKAPHLCAAIQGQNCIGRQRPKTHGRDVKYRDRVGLGAVFAAHCYAKGLRARVHGCHRMAHPLHTRGIHILHRSKTALIVLDLRALIDKRPLITREGDFLFVVF